MKERTKSFVFLHNNQVLVTLKRDAGFYNGISRKAGRHTGISCYKHRQHYLSHREKQDHKYGGAALPGITLAMAHAAPWFRLSATRLLSFVTLPRPAYYTALFRYVLF